MYSAVGIHKRDYRVLKHVICVKNDGADAHIPSEGFGGTRPRY